MPCHGHRAPAYPLPLLASLVAPSPASGVGDWPPPSLASLPSLPPQAGVGYACPWSSCTGLPPPPACFARSPLPHKWGRGITPSLARSFLPPVPSPASGGGICLPMDILKRLTDYRGFNYPAVPAERRRQGGRGPNFPNPPTLRRSASVHGAIMSLIINRISHFRAAYQGGAPGPLPQRSALICRSDM